MIAKLKKELTVPSSLCDNTAKLSVQSIFSVFMDLATEHANSLNVGSTDLSEKGFFWIATKSKIIINKRPAMSENINAATWPQMPEKIRFNRFYTLSDKKDELLIAGKTEWTLINKENGRPQRADGIYPENIEYIDEIPFEDSFSKINTEIQEANVFDEYIVKSTDIDLYQHMNNVAYIRAVMGTYSCSELEKMNIRSFEISYRSPCFEGDKLKIYKNKYDTFTNILIFKDNILACAIRIEY